ncbi:MAG: adenylate cyclase [Candidatus Marinimicrobia bacterium]|nr:adenylate cyclase [Candidatus Neomarinimicrobiota bacterium]
MAKEIERKFLVDQDLLPKNIIGEEYIQAYIAINDQGIVRIRIKGSIALLTIKTSEKGMTRNEFEYEVPLEDAKSLVELFNDKIIYKTRYKITIDKKLWEVDEFHKENKGLWLAEIELESENELFSLPEWIKKEVTGDHKYFNAYLSENPFKFWNNE